MGVQPILLFVFGNVVGSYVLLCKLQEHASCYPTCY